MMRLCYSCVQELSVKRSTLYLLRDSKYLLRDSNVSPSGDTLLTDECA